MNSLITDDQTYTYTYDDNGNLTQKTHKTTKATMTFDWDIENRLIQVTKHETEKALPSETITYAYDALGRRIEKNINGNIKRYVYDNEDILMEFNGDNLYQKFYLHGLGIDDPVAVFDDSIEKIYYYHKDGLGSIISLTDENGDEKEKYVYDAFGKATIFNEEDRQIASSQLGNPYFFTGREYDNETGLQYHRDRYFNPETGTWISEELLGIDGPNLYWYSLNNSVNNIDLSGLWAVDKERAEKHGTSLSGLKPEITSIEVIVDIVYQTTAQKDAIVTSTTEGVHSENSLHYTGQAIDLRTRNIEKEEHREQIARFLKNLLGDDYDVVHKKVPPHIHIEYDPKVCK